MEESAYLAVADSHRREVLCALLDRPATDVSTLVAGSGAETEELRIRLYHQHLPMLAESGYVRWDRERGSVERGPHFDAVRPLVEFHVNEFGSRAESDAAEPDTVD